MIGATVTATAIGLFMLAFARRFYVVQNVQRAIGGPITVQKALWLGYAVGSWFLVPIALLLAPGLDRALVTILICHLASWWLRGPIELVMIYKTLNWSPVYGISHDLAHLALLVSLGAATTGDVAWNQPINAIVGLYLAVTVCALVVEVAFAALFRRARGTAPGADLIYFASDDPAYRFINRLTLVTVIVVYGHFAFQLGWLYWLWLA